MVPGGKTFVLHLAKRSPASSVRYLSSTCPRSGILKNIYNSFVSEADLDKKPSPMEIAEKKLPLNTPTLEQRIKRDELMKFHNTDRHGGYHIGQTGSWTDFVDENMTIKDLVVESFSTLKNECKKLAHEKMNVDYFKMLIKPGK
jgi:hypothetical protein